MHGVSQFARMTSLILGVAAAFQMMKPAGAQTPSLTWTTLGTNSGPIPNPKRMEPANLLLNGNYSVLVDAGDGASEQLIKAGVPLARLDAVVISHLHFDHTGGLFAVISERYQVMVPGILTIYGPPGTKATVDGLLAAMAASPAAGASRPNGGPKDTVKVIEVTDGQEFKAGDVAVTAVRNSHYDVTPNSTNAMSLSYRFSTPERVIVYTGDTGPSEKVEHLAAGADLLISEIIDSDFVLGRLKRERPDLPAPALAAMKRHFDQEHLSPTEMGLLAQRAGVKALVLTHDGIDPDETERMRPAIAANYKGPIVFARDLDKF